MSKIFACILGGLMVGFVGCADPFTANPETSPLDEDDDGYTKGKDCDDSDPTVHPLAPELENCKDDNCDGRVDEGTPNEDMDGDGFCPSTGDLGSCEGDRERHPSAAEDGGNGSGQPDGVDNNCNNLVDEGLPGSDVDRDGFTVKDGDCNDNDANISPGAVEVFGMQCKAESDCPIGKCYDGYCRCTQSSDCSSGKACVNNNDCTFPGETCQQGKCQSSYVCLDAPKNMPNPTLKVCRDQTDNDCDKQIDEMPDPCDALNGMNQNEAYDYAAAIELCPTDRACNTDGTCPGSMRCRNGKCTHVLSAAFNSDAALEGHGIDLEFAKDGPFKPRMGQTFAILSTGLARYEPAKNCPQNGTEFKNTHADPDPATKDKEALDYTELSLELLVPSNAQSFEFDFQFFSTEYPEWVGSEFNDTFWVQLQSKKFTGNISFDKNGTPIRINNSFFDICDPSPETPQTQKMCTQPAILLNGTGYYTDCKPDDPMGSSGANGGSTGWLHTQSPVTPGEKIKLTFSIFDKGDRALDSTVLIDNFRWKLSPSSRPSTGPD